MKPRSRIGKIVFASFSSIILFLTILWSILQGAPASINATGSRSMLPLYFGYSSAYTHSYDEANTQIKKTDVDVNVSSGGSGRGQNDIAEGVTDIGNMSSRMIPSQTSQALDKSWNDRQIRTVTVARDAIALVVKTPTGMTFEQDASVSNLPIVSVKVLADLYGNNTDRPTWGALIKGATGSGANTQVQAYGRTGGKSASGTSEAFFAGFKNFLNPSDKDLLNNLDINHDQPKITKTQEANSIALASLLAGQQGITYLSLGYAENAVKGNNSIHLAAVVGDAATTSTPVAPTTATIDNNSYQWVRPFNSAFSERAGVYVKNFIKWMLEIAINPADIIVQNNVIALKTQITPETPNGIYDLPVIMTKAEYDHGHAQFLAANAIYLKSSMVWEQLKFLSMSDQQLNNGTATQKLMAYGLDLHGWIGD